MSNLWYHRCKLWYHRCTYDVIGYQGSRCGPPRSGPGATSAGGTGRWQPALTTPTNSLSLARCASASDHASPSVTLDPPASLTRMIFRLVSNHAVHLQTRPFQFRMQYRAILINIYKYLQHRTTRTILSDIDFQIGFILLWIVNNTEKYC